MVGPRPIVLFAAGVLLFASPVFAADRAETAQSILAEAKRAAGGAAWDRMQGWTETGEHDGVQYETWLDPHRYAMTVRESQDGKVRTHGFDGKVDWRIAADGTVKTARDAAAISDARQSAYFSISGFFFPDRFPAKAELLGRQTVDGKVFDVLSITPEGSKPLEVWFDHETHLMVRGVDRSSPQPVVITASDFRSVGGVMVAFHLTVSDGDPAHAQEGRLTAVDLAPVDPAVFSPPAAGAAH